MTEHVAAMEPLVVFGAIAALIFLGFLGNLIFSRLRFNDTIILIAVGVLLGPVFRVVEPQSLAAASAVIGPLALILILFDGGLALKFRDLLHGVGSAASLGVLGFTFTTAGVGVLVAWALKVDVMVGLILGAILGGTSALVVLPSLQHMKTSKKTGTALGLESAITDVLVVVVAFTLISIVALGAGPDAQSVASKLVITFAMSIFIGVAAAFLWLYLTPGIKDKPFGYMMTLGMMFALYVVVEWLLQDISNGGGPLSVLAFGVVLGNASSLGAAIRRRAGDDFAPGIRKFQGELSFIVRTFFFVYLGILVDIDLLQNLHMWALGIAILGVILAARYLSVSITTRTLRLQGEAATMWVMLPRGLAAAVMAAEPVRQNIAGTEPFVALAFMLLILTNLFSTVGAIVLEKYPRDEVSVARRRVERQAKRAEREKEKAAAEERAAAKERPTKPDSSKRGGLGDEELEFKSRDEPGPVKRRPRRKEDKP